MKLNPQQAPLYGECLLTVQLCEEECVEDEEDVEFYLLFAGSTQRHVSSTLKISHVTLQAVCPAHDRSETVRVTLCQARPGGSVDPVAEEHFQFVQDLALDMAQFLVNAAGKTEGALLLDECQIPLKECERLDDTLALALKHLPLPSGWSVLGTDFPVDTGTETSLGIEPGPQETLLHFAAKRGLRKVALFLLQQPGGREALRLPNKQGRTPARVAQKRGHSQLQKLLTEFENFSELETKTFKWHYPGGRVLRHHPKLNTYTLALEDVPGSPPPSLQCDVEELQRLIQSHQKNKIQEDPPIQCKPALLILNRDSSESTEPAEFNSLDSEHLESRVEQQQSCELVLSSSVVEDELCPCQNGTGDHVQSRDGKVEPESLTVGDSGKLTDKANCAQWWAKVDSVAFSAPSCGNQQEEADRELCVICAKQGADKENQEELEASETETDNKAQSGNPEVQDMGHTQSQGPLPTETSQPSQIEEENERSKDLSQRGDLPEEREEERGCSQEIGSNSSAHSSYDSESNFHHNDRNEDTLAAESSVVTDDSKVTEIQVNSEVTLSEQNSATVNSDSGDEPHGRLETETGNLGEHMIGNTESVSGLVADENSIKQNSGFSNSEGDLLDSTSIWPKMAPGPIHKVRQGLSPVPETFPEGPTVEHLFETTEDSQQPQEVTSSLETVSECQEILLNDSVCDINEKEGDSDGSNEVLLCQYEESVVSKAVLAPSETMQNPEKISREVASSEVAVTEDIADSDLDEKSKPSDEASLPVVFEALIVNDVQQNASTKRSSELSSEVIIIGTPLGNEEMPKTVLSDSMSRLVPEECSGDTPEEPSNPAHKVSALKGEHGEKDVTHKEPLQANEIDSPSQETIRNLPDQLEITHNDDAESKAQIELPESSKETANTTSEPTTAYLGDRIEDFSCASALTESEDSRPCKTPLTDEIIISDGETCVDKPTNMSQTTVSEDVVASSIETTSGSALELKNSSISDPFNAFSSSVEVTSLMDINSGLPQGLEHTSPVDIDNGLIEQPQPSDRAESLNGLHENTHVCSMEINERVEQHTAEPHVKPITEDGSLAGDMADGHQDSSADITNSEVIHRETETFYSVDATRDAGLKENKSSSMSSEFPPSTPSPESVHKESASTMRGSVSDGDSIMSQDLGEDNVFNNKGEDTVTITGDSTSGVSMSYSSSTDDTSSVGTPSAVPQASQDALPSDPCAIPPASPESSPVTGETEEEERKDRLTEVPERSTILRSSIRSLSPFRRHSWGPGKNSVGETEMSQRSSVRSEVERRSAGHRRSMSWCPSVVLHSEGDEINGRSYSLEGLSAEKNERKPLIQHVEESSHEPSCPSKLDREERGSLVSLTEEEQESDLGDCSSLDSQKCVQSGRRCVQPAHPILAKSVSMLAISHKDLDVIGRPRPKRRISFSFSITPMLAKSKTLFSIGSSSSDEEEAVRLGSFTGTSGSLEYSISEEDPGPLRSDSEFKGGGTKVSRTFSYLKSKMSKKNKEKEKEKNKERERDAKDKERRASNGHLFTAVTTVPTNPCHQCNKPINTKDAFLCTNCNAQVHKGCRESLPVCAKVKMKQKQQQTVTDSALVPAVTLRSKTLPARERPWSTISIPDDQPAPLAPPRKSPSGIMSFNSNPLSKSMSINNIVGQMEDPPLKSLKFLSQSTDSLHKTSKVSESTESLTDEGTEMMDSQFMGEFEADAKELEADSWSFTVDKKYLKQLKKDVIKRQDVIFELIQTEMHHVRTLKIMADVYSKGLQREVQLEVHTVEKIFPMLEDLLDLHTQFFTHLVERKKEAGSESHEEGGFVIRKIGDVLVSQFSGSNAERMKKVYGKFCSRHNESVNFYKELHTKDKRFQAFIKKKMSSPVVRRLSIPECILLVTQRITKYPVLLQRILQHTKENEEDHADVTQGLKLVKEVIAAVDNKVNEHEKKKRLKEVYSRTDSKSIMRMKSGQMFAREDLLRGQKLIHDGSLQLKNSAGRLKDVQALLLRDVIVFLQEKDQKYIFASLDQRSTVISLQKLILREVANEEKGLFLITAGIEKPEMVEVYASSKEERNTWMQLIQQAMQSILSISFRERDDDEGVPSENEEDKRLQEIKVKELRDQLHKRDEQILALLEEKVKVFRDMCDCGMSDETVSSFHSRMLFRATPDDITKGEPIMKDALKEVEMLQVLVNGSLGGAVQDGVCATGPVSLPRRAETFGGFDSHQMNISKSKDGDREETDDSAELRRTESDSVLKKTSNTNPLLLLKRNNEILQSVVHLHDLLNTLQAVVVQQDTFIEDQRYALNTQPSSRHPSISSTSSCSSSSSRPSSLIEQEKQRSLEKQRQEVACLQKQQAAHAEERKRREKEWEARELELAQREAQLQTQEEDVQRRHKMLEEQKQDLQSQKEEYQRDLARLRDSQKKLEREREQLQRDAEHIRQIEAQRKNRSPSTTSEDSSKFQSSGSLDRDPSEVELSSSPSARDFLSRMDSIRKGKNLNPFSSNSSQKSQNSEAQSQTHSRLLQLAKPKEKKDKKKKKKGKGQQSQTAESQSTVVPDANTDGEIFFC
ncbi:A-kinase anchor protein 13-like isoform X3 [Myxocyprinus asiaticus]|uniref:A-kinase anchor protein 13-like isoform X3 n=1 Tax=Myxocyprinus asiaticus TaxID=70543 RepID=UPI002222C705|nr:A-kinase anchor protein 13-like isoform X3 [Myxocyprinus asiaticus]